MHAGNVQLELLRGAAVESQRERRPEAFRSHVGDTDIGGSGGSVRHDAAFYLRDERLNGRFIEAKNGGAVEGYLVNERQERRLDVLEIAIVVEVIGFDVRDNRDGRGKQEK